MTHPLRRAEVRLPAEMLDEFGAVATRRGHVLATLAHGWVIDAARIAQEGGQAGDHPGLPPARSGGLGPERTGKPLRWKQSAEESEECVRVIKGAGSSVREVVGAAIRAYVASDGDLLRMSWPQPRAELATAV